MTVEWPKSFPAVDAMTFINSGQDKVFLEFIFRSQNVLLEPAVGIKKHFRGGIDYLELSVFDLVE